MGRLPGARGVPGAEIVLHTDTPAVASVSVDGYVRGGRSGLATITVTSGEHRQDVPVAVTP